ncbi:DUF2339 domain-containing protein [Paraburkholderia phenoliruptrix]|uniref:DUF2339 domain-containing protein n=1 Tax=Paraburkholderia phenoliruptrix TaxID=252970 RepID=UPI001C6F58E1|nr:DUF2339 domain-containing protein [Paraburkholderia phenoliruptrix]MBW9104006.1 DUF2339 domain-containing protein [Paraburkholderia phenoliruptrix]MBW9130591.1 DUF2339 domain-containing protein [Paraburkholderia ginsengiterrae]
MSVIFVVLGAVVGILASLSNDLPLGYGALFGALAGLALARLRTKDSASVAHPPLPGASATAASGAPRDLAARVEWLERELVTLRSEVRQLRDASDLAPAEGAPDVSGTPSIQAGSVATMDDPSAALVPSHPFAIPPQDAATPAANGSAVQASAVHASATADAAASIDRQMQTPATMPASVSARAAAAGSPPAGTPAAPVRGPGLVERVVKAGRDWLFGGNTVVRVGIVVLFFGIAFLLKYAADNSLLPVELRLAGVALAATVLLGFGWRIGESRGAYGLVLQGGAVGALYLTVFAATRLYHVLPSAAAFPLMIATCALSAFLAIRQDAPSLAFMGSAGGFLAPLLLSTGGGSHVMLFSYYALLNAGIFAIAWFKAWRALNLLGFVFTFSIGAAWGATAYRPELFASTEPFLILFFLMYVGIALLYAIRRELTLRHYVDGTLVFGTPLVAMGLQSALMRGTEFGLAWSAVALAVFYLAISGWLAPRRARLGLLFDSMFALAVIFATLAVPLAFSGPTTSATWAIEGAAVTWLAVRQRRIVAFGFGLLMQLAAAGAFVVDGVMHFEHTAALPVLNGAYLASVLIALAGVFTGWRLHGRSEARDWHAWMPQTGVVASIWGLLWWVAGGLNEIHTYLYAFLASDRERAGAALIGLFAALSAWLAHGARRRLLWPLAEWPALALVPVLAALTVSVFSLNTAPVSGYGWLACALIAAPTYALLWRQQRAVGERILAPLHTLMFWSVAALVALQGYWTLRAYVPEGAWSWSAWAYGFGTLLLLLAGVAQRLRWPVARFTHAYQVWAAVPLAALLWMWSIASVMSDGSAAPLFWLPLVNPLDVAQILVFVAGAVWLRRLRALGVQWHRRPFDYAVLATFFLWFNALLLRTLHHWVGVPYEFAQMSQSTLVQASLSVFWTLCALAMMIWATRRASRIVWFIGGGLLGATVVKLFLFDLSHVSGIERIVSFIGIGVMLLLIGYFSPLPPKLVARETEQ